MKSWVAEEEEGSGAARCFRNFGHEPTRPGSPCRETDEGKKEEGRKEEAWRFKKKKFGP